MSTKRSYTRSALLSEEVRALENRLKRLLEHTTRMKGIERRINELHAQQAARAAEILVLERAAVRLLGRMSGLSAILTAKTFPVPDPVETAAPRSRVTPLYNPGSQPPRRVVDTALRQWLVARYKMYRGRVRP